MDICGRGGTARCCRGLVTGRWRSQPRSDGFRSGVASRCARRGARNAWRRSVGTGRGPRGDSADTTVLANTGTGSGYWHARISDGCPCSAGGIAGRSGGCGYDSGSGFNRTAAGTCSAARSTRGSGFGSGSAGSVAGGGAGSYHAVVPTSATAANSAAFFQGPGASPSTSHAGLRSANRATRSLAATGAGSGAAGNRTGRHLVCSDCRAGGCFSAGRWAKVRTSRIATDRRRGGTGQNGRGAARRTVR